MGSGLGGGRVGLPCCAFSPQAERIAQSEQLAPITVSFPCRTPYAQFWHIWHWVWLLGQSGARCLQWRLTTAAQASGLGSQTRATESALQ